VRALAIAALLCATAAADPLAVRALREETRAPRRDARVAAAHKLAERILYGDVARSAALVAVISNDPDVRSPLVTMLIAANVIDPSSAARIPSLDTLDSMLHVLVHDPLLAATECSVTATDPRTVLIRCEHAHCADSCRRESVIATLAIGTRWTVVTHEHTSVLDGETCGGCE
jgi:hypothetical protein